MFSGIAIAIVIAIALNICISKRDISIKEL